MSSVLVMVTDERGFNIAEISAAVAVETQENIDAVIVFTVGFSVPDGHALSKKASEKNIRVEFRTLEMDADLYALHINQGQHEHVTHATAMKFSAIYSLQNEFDRALYIDNDILLMRNFNISRIDFEMYPVAAVYDIAKTGELPGDESFMSNCSVAKISHHYFNSGVIVANLKLFNDVLSESYSMNYKQHRTSCQYNEKCSCKDQCAWNLTFERNWKRLPLTFNFQACALFHDEWTFATVRHYVGPRKFFPIRAWRNDSRDTKLIDLALAVLGRRGSKRSLPHLTRSINKFRHRRAIKDVGAAVNRVNELFCEEM